MYVHHSSFKMEEGCQSLRRLAYKLRDDEKKHTKVVTVRTWFPSFSHEVEWHCRQQKVTEFYAYAAQYHIANGYSETDCLLFSKDVARLENCILQHILDREFTTDCAHLDN